MRLLAEKALRDHKAAAGLRSLCQPPKCQESRQERRAPRPGQGDQRLGGSSSSTELAVDTHGNSGGLRERHAE